MIMKVVKKRRGKEKSEQPATLVVGEMAPLLGVHASTIRRWSQMGILEYLRMGSSGYRMALQDDFERFPEQ